VSLRDKAENLPQKNYREGRALSEKTIRDAKEKRGTLEREDHPLRREALVGIRKLRNIR